MSNVQVTKSELPELIQAALKQAGVDEIVERFRESGGKLTPAPVPTAITETKGKDGASVTGKMVRALAANKGIRRVARDWAAEVYGPEDEATKALSLTSEVDGAILVPTEYSSEIIELLYNESVVLSMGPRTVPIAEGEVGISRLDSGATFSWTGLGGRMVPSQPGFGQLKVKRHKGTAFVPISNDLLRTKSGAKADNFVRDDMAMAIQVGVDLAYIQGSGSEHEPLGMRGWGIKTASNGTVIVANVMADLVGCLVRAAAANIPMRKCGWLMSPATWGGLFSALDANSNRVWQDEMKTGTILGYPFKKTAQVADGDVYFVDFDHVVIGDAEGLLIDASGDASYISGATTKHTFQDDETAVRAITYTDLVVRHPQAVQVITGCDWDAIPASA